MSTIFAEHVFQAGQVLQICRGDLTEERVDAIVNAANAHLAHGGGVAGAIVHKGGEAIQRESTAWVAMHGPVTHAEPAYTGAGHLPCRYVIHAVGPVWGEGEEDRKLAEAVHGSLHLAEDLELSSIAFPAISTGIFGFPKERAARIILETIQAYFAENGHSRIRQVHLTLNDEATLESFLKVYRQWQSDDHVGA